MTPTERHWERIREMAVHPYGTLSPTPPPAVAVDDPEPFKWPHVLGGVLIEEPMTADYWALLKAETVRLAAGIDAHIVRGEE